MNCIIVIYLDAGWVVVDHVEDVDQAEQDGDQQTHPASNNLRGNNEWGPGDENKQSRW